jgi:hypothetical protein
MLGFLMNRWVLGGIAGLVMLGFSYWKGYTAGKDNIQQKWDADKVVWERELYAAQSKARQIEQQMQTKADKIQKEKLNAVKTANAKYNALIDSLRNRPETRADGMPEGADNAVGCTGAGLARPDAEFLAGYSADAAKLQAAYNSCRQAYEVIQNATQ